jgi:hypothetical protein
MAPTGAFLDCYASHGSDPYSRSAQVAKPKRRTRESRFLLQIRADDLLLQQVVEAVVED